MTMNEVMVKVANVNKSGYVSVELCTTPTLTKKSRSTGLPFKGSVQCHSKFAAIIGSSYQDAARAVKDDPTFKASKPFGKHYVKGCSWLLQSDKDEGQFYVSMKPTDKVMTSEYFINGRKATPEEVEDLKENYLPIKKGVREVAWLTCKVESIVDIH